MSVWTLSIPWGAQRLGLVLLPDGYFFVGFFMVEADAKTALEAELERRRQLRKTPSGEGGEPALARPQANQAHDAKAER